MGRLMGPSSKAAYDRQAPVPADMADLAVEMQANISRLGPAPVASSAYAVLLCGDERALFCALNWDALTCG
jgi:hypothetical protein